MGSEGCASKTGKKGGDILLVGREEEEGGEENPADERDKAHGRGRASPPTEERPALCLWKTGRGDRGDEEAGRGRPQTGGMGCCFVWSSRSSMCSQSGTGSVRVGRQGVGVPPDLFFIVDKKKLDN
jgi:hypothetical protein